MQEDYGHLEIRLDELLKKKGLSKNKLSYKAEMNWKQIDNYGNDIIVSSSNTIRTEKRPAFLSADHY